MQSYSWSFPIVAAIAGFANTDDNLGPGSYNYAYFGGTGGEGMFSCLCCSVFPSLTHVSQCPLAARR